MTHPIPIPPHDTIVDRVDIGIFSLNKAMEVVLWNKFMGNNSGIKSADIIGHNIFERFPQLPKKWLQKKIENVFILKNFAFTSWQQRPFLFDFPNRSTLTSNVVSMRQNCTFIPVKGQSDEIEFVCITIIDVTDSSIYQMELVELTEQLEIMSHQDGLTKIYNRRHLDEQMHKEFNRSKRYGGPLSIVHMDIDHFKAVNDTYGHLAGDEILRQVAQRLTACLRKDDCLGRYGGEEFTVILPSTGQEGALFLAERLRESIADTLIQWESQSLAISISLGVSTLHSGIKKYENLLKEADEALYYSKDHGRNKVTVYHVGQRQSN